MTNSAPERGGGLATNSQFYTFPWGSPREARPRPKTQPRRLEASAEVAMVAVQESRVPSSFLRGLPFQTRMVSYHRVERGQCSADCGLVEAHHAGLTALAGRG